MIEGVGDLPSTYSGVDAFVSASVWSDRVAQQLSQADGHSVVVCSETSGIKWAVRRMELSSSPVIRIWVERENGSDLSKQLVDSINQSIGFELVEANADVPAMLSTIQRFAQQVGNLRVVIGWLEFCTDFASELLKRAGNDLRLLAITHDDDDWTSRFGLTRIQPDILRLRPEEALVAKSSSVDSTVIQNAYIVSEGQFGSFLEAIANASVQDEPTGDPVLLNVPRPAIDPFERATRGSIRVLWAQGRVVEAFELACTDLPELVPQLIERAGNFFFDHGAFHYFWDCIRALPRDTQDVPIVAYWLYAAAAATNNMAEVHDQVLSVVHRVSAPDLRAAMAVMRPDVDVDRETARALEEAESPTTVRARAFALALGGDRHVPILLLRRAMALAEGIDANHLVVACALDISNQEITLGRLSRGREWARWALRQYEERQLSECYRRQVALAGLAYSALLMGEHNEVAAAIEKMEPNLAHLGVPTYESVISTVGDWYLYNEDPNYAEYYYSQVLSRSPVTQYASASLDVVKARLAQGDIDGANELAKSAFSLSRSSSVVERAFGSLALGMVSTEIDSKRAGPLLQEAAKEFAGTNYAIFEAQSLMWLALAALQATGSVDARRILELVSPVVGEFGESGWRFLLANSERSSDLVSMGTGVGERFSLRFLGQSSVFLGSEQVHLARRQCEILAILVSRPEGVTSQKLQLLLYGDLGSSTTTKATVSRLRKLVPISKAPYRLLPGVRADFLEVLRALEDGNLERVLALYGGPLLPDSDAPGVIELRDHIEESIRGAVLASGDADLLINLGNKFEDDLETWETARLALNSGDRRRPLIDARIRRIKANW